MTKEQEGQKEGQASPHPRLETLNCQVHVVTLSQGSKSVQTATLVVVLEKLDKTLVQAVGEKLIPEHLVEYAFRPVGRTGQLDKYYGANSILANQR